MTLEQSLNKARRFVQKLAAQRGLLNNDATQALLETIDRKDRFLPVSCKVLLLYEYFLLMKEVISPNDDGYTDLNNIINDLLLSLLEHLDETRRQST